MQFTNPEPIEPTTDTELIEAINAVQVAEHELTEAEERKAQARERLVGLLRARGKKSVWAETPEGLRKVTVVTPERMKVDAEGLRKAIGVRAFNKIAAYRVDNKKLEKAIHSFLDLETVAPFVQVVPSTAYVRISEPEGEL